MPADSDLTVVVGGGSSVVAGGGVQTVHRFTVEGCLQTQSLGNVKTMVNKHSFHSRSTHIKFGGVGVFPLFTDTAVIIGVT